MNNNEKKARYEKWQAIIDRRTGSERVITNSILQRAKHIIGTAWLLPQRT